MSRYLRGWRHWGVYVLSGIILFGAGGAAGYILHSSSYPSLALANRVGGYTFVNPLLTCDLSEDQPYDGFSSLQRALQSEITTLKKSGDIDRVSVYFRDMNYGTWSGVNVDETYIPASLMKVPLMMAYLKASQTSPALLDQKYIIPAGTDANAGENFKPANPLAPGGYTVNQLLQAMIIGSDNNAETVLGDNVSTTSIEDVYNTLDLPSGDENAENMSPKDYMVLFRVLYNATYIGRTRSQTALDMLSKSEFTGGIAASVDGHTVSHKFGERSVYTQAPGGPQLLQKRELHDCGIVYYPGSPYGLCIMTEGSNFDRMQHAIADLSGVVYKQVDEGLLDQH